MSFSTDKEVKCRANFRKPSVVQDEQTKSTTHARRPAKTVEAAFTENVLRSSTEKDIEVKTSTNIRRKLAVKNDEAKSKPNTRRQFTAQEEEHKHTSHSRQPSTVKDKESKITQKVRESVTAKDKEARNKANSRSHLTTQDEKVKTTPNPRRPMAVKDKETDYTANGRPSLKSKKEKVGQVTSKDNMFENTTHIRESVTSNVENSSPNIHEPAIATDKDSKNTENSHHPLKVKDEKAKLSANVIAPLKTKDQKARNKANIQFSSTSEDVKAKITAGIRQSLIVKDKEVKSTSRIRGPLATKDKGSKKTGNINGPVTSNDKAATVNVRRPRMFTNKESEIKTHIRRPGTSEDKESRNKANSCRPLTGTEKGVKSLSLIQDTSTDKDSKKTKIIPQPLTTKDKEHKKQIREPVTLLHEEAINQANIQKLLTTKDEEAEISTHARESNIQEGEITSKIRRPFMAKDREDKSVANTRRPLTARHKQDKISTYINGQISAKDKNAKMSAHILRPVPTKDKECKSTAHINQALATKDKEVKHAAHSQWQLTIKNDEAKVHYEFTADKLEDDTKRVMSAIDNGECKGQTTNLLDEKVNKQMNCPNRNTETDNKSIHSHKVSKVYAENENGFNLKQFVKNEDNFKIEFSPSMALFAKSKDEEMMETSKDVLKTCPGDLQYAESSVKIPTLEKSFKRDKFNLHDNKNHSHPVFNSNKVDKDVPIASHRIVTKGKDTESTTCIRRPLTGNKTSDATKMRKSMLANASSEYKQVKIDESVRGFPECTTEAKCLDKQSWRHAQDEKYLNHLKTQTGNEGSFKTEAVQPITHSDKSREATNIKHLETHTIKSTSDISNNTIQKSMEINGCRPKQRSNVQKEYAKSQALTRKRQEDVHFVFKITEISFLKNLMDEKSDVIVSELTRSPSLLKNCIEKTAKDETIMALFLQILAKAYSSTTTLQLMIPLFETLKVTGFFDILVEYLARIIIQIKSRQRDGYTYDLVLKQILSITISQITRNPSSLVAFRKLHALMGQVIDELVENGTVDEQVVAEYQRFTEHKKAIEKERKQPTEPKQYK